MYFSTPSITDLFASCFIISSAMYIWVVWPLPFLFLKLKRRQDHAECVLVKDPFTYPKADSEGSGGGGGGSILQRFGSPSLSNSTSAQSGAYHFFGLDRSTEPGPLTAMHNLHYERRIGDKTTTTTTMATKKMQKVAAMTTAAGIDSDEDEKDEEGDHDEVYEETVSVFGNTMIGSDVSQVFTFDLNLVPEESPQRPEEGGGQSTSTSTSSSSSGSSSSSTTTTSGSDDSVFATPYRKCELSYHEETWGGARRLGETVWLVGRNDISPVDLQHNELNPDSSTLNTSVYDPFITVCVQGCGLT
jgi:hypothetical protein